MNVWEIFIKLSFKPEMWPRKKFFIRPEIGRYRSFSLASNQKFVRGASKSKLYDKDVSHEPLNRNRPIKKFQRAFKPKFG